MICQVWVTVPCGHGVIGQYLAYDAMYQNVTQYSAAIRRSLFIQTTHNSDPIVTHHEWYWTYNLQQWTKYAHLTASL